MTRRVEAGPILVTVGALLLLASLFMDWYTPGITAWQAFEVWDVVLLVLSVGCIIAGIGLAVPDLDVVDRRLLPWAAGAVTLIALSQILDPPPAAAGQDPELGGIFALAGAAVMIAGGLLTFGRVGVAVHHGAARPAPARRRPSTRAGPPTRPPTPMSRSPPSRGGRRRDRPAEAGDAGGDALPWRAAVRPQRA